MKVIKYQYVTEVNLGSEENPQYNQITATKEMEYSDENYQLALSEAYNQQVQIEDVPDTRPLFQIKSDKEAELSAICHSVITEGIDVETTKGTEHFSLQETDQINLTTALSSVKAGAAVYPYHADGQLCRMFTADEIKKIAETAISYTLYHKTLCNHLLAWVRRSETPEEIGTITYSADNLPDDLAANMESILTQSASVEEV